MACMRALRRTLDTDFHFLKMRGMRVTQPYDNMVLLEDLDEWLWVYQQKLMHRCDERLTFDVYAQGTDVCDAVSSFRICITTSEQHWAARVLNYMLAWLSVFIFLAWISEMHRVSGANLADMVRFAHPEASAGDL